MKVSVYTFVKDGLVQDYHVVDMLRHHLDFADEIVVHEGFSTDGTYEAISNIDSKIKVFRSDWDRHEGMAWVNQFKDEARKRCTGDWCVLLDADEFIPDWEFDNLRRLMQATDKLTLPMSLLNFYGSYRVYNAFPERFRMPALKMNIHRNRPDIVMHGGDASSVRVRDQDFVLQPGDAVCQLHHFGTVRKPARLRQLWRNMRGRLYNAPPPRFALPSCLFDLFPHDWKDPDFLPYLRVYDGPYCKAVLQNPAEFTRDGMELYRYLAGRTTDEA
jgi:glycosyltransferase involved in cell wall biosynthesis